MAVALEIGARQNQLSHRAAERRTKDHRFPKGGNGTTIFTERHFYVSPLKIWRHSIFNLKPLAVELEHS